MTEILWKYDYEIKPLKYWWFYGEIEFLYWEY